MCRESFSGTIEERAQSVNDSMRIRTDTTLDQDCVLKANCAGMYSVHDRVIVVNCIEFIKILSEIA